MFTRYLAILSWCIVALYGLTSGRFGPQRVDAQEKAISYGSVRGRVLDLAGKPLAGGSIYLSRPLSSSDGSGELYALATTDKAGLFSLTRVAPRADYTVICILDAAAVVYRGSSGEVSQVRVRNHETTAVSIRIDTIKPQIAAPQAPRVVSGKVKVRYKASDNVGISDVYAGVDGTGLSDKPSDSHVDFVRNQPLQAQGVFEWNTRRVPNGRHRLRLETSDQAGNRKGREWFVWVLNKRAPAAK